MNLIPTKPIRNDFFLRGQFDENIRNERSSLKPESIFAAAKVEFKDGLSSVLFEDSRSAMNKQKKVNATGKAPHANWADRISFAHCCIAFLILSGITAVLLLQPNGLHLKNSQAQETKNRSASIPNGLDQKMGSLEVSGSEQNLRMEQQMAQAKADRPPLESEIKQEKKSPEEDIPTAWQEPEKFENAGLAGKSYYALTHRDPTGDFKR